MNKCQQEIHKDRITQIHKISYLYKTRINIKSTNVMIKKKVKN